MASGVHAVPSKVSVVSLSDILRERRPPAEENELVSEGSETRCHELGRIGCSRLGGPLCPVEPPGSAELEEDDTAVGGGGVGWHARIVGRGRGGGAAVFAAARGERRKRDKREKSEAGRAERVRMRRRHAGIVALRARVGTLPKW